MIIPLVQHCNTCVLISLGHTLLFHCIMIQISHHTKKFKNTIKRIVSPIHSTLSTYMCLKWYLNYNSVTTKREAKETFPDIYSSKNYLLFTCVACVQHTGKSEWERKHFFIGTIDIALQLTFFSSSTNCLALNNRSSVLLVISKKSETKNCKNKNFAVEFSQRIDCEIVFRLMSC